MPLMIAPIGENLKITKVSTDEKTKRHLENLGILEGESVLILSQQSGSIIIKIKEGRIALDKRLAGKIFVA